ncbi:unnamed protein product, partial [Staurois parvus]
MHSLYLVSHRPCIHYIWSPTVHRTRKCNYFSKYKLLNTFSHQQYIAVLWLLSVSSPALACRRNFLSAL